MYCPFCRNPDSRVVDSRIADDGSAIRRRRQCPECGRRFTTVETTSLTVIKRSGRRIQHMDWYTALAYWKSAVFMEGNYRRAVYGMSDDPLLLGFRSGVEELAELGLAALRR